MADLRNTLDKKKGTKVLVNGTIYEIDADGIARGVSAEDAKKLLAQASRVWRLVDGKTPAKPKPEPTPEPEPTPVPDETVAEAVEEHEESFTDDSADEEESGTDEWPDPDPSMDIDYLRQMADAYEVKHNSRTSKKKLVAAIREAMYGEE